MVLTLAVDGVNEIIPGFIRLVYRANTGAAFSIFADHRWMLSAIQFIVTIILIAILLRYNEGFWGTLGLASVLGGAIGNLYDRVVHGYVVDMFQFVIFPRFAIFNVADIFITLGGITFCIYFIISSVRSDSKDKLPSDYDQEDDYRDEDYDEQYEEQYEQYEAPDEADDAGSDHLSDTRVIPGKRKASGRGQESYYEPVQEQPDYYEPVREQADYNEPLQEQTVDYESEQEQQEYYAYEPTPEQQDFYEPVQEQQDYYEPARRDVQEDFSSTLDALGALESELGSFEDYDVDDLLREYGFEDENK